MKLRLSTHLSSNKTHHFSNFTLKQAPLIREHSYWILGNGRRINIWTDWIMNKEPLENRIDTRDLRAWMDNNGLRILRDISRWHDENWAGWKSVTVPDHLRKDWNTLTEYLHGLAPTQLRKQDQKGWGTHDRGYTVAMGYRKLIEKPHVPPDLAPWHGVWRTPSWPMTDFFAWKLYHEIILTHNILQRKGIYGPSICHLCKENSETAAHIMLECNFSKRIWSSFVQNLNYTFLLPNSIVELFSNWTARYPGQPSRN